ncbi:mechanosensitive ion channel family protein [Thalassobacillus sp. CUG 92003]|uniref:mechanosensitive ion channel family protein n=1 Tax=Thalassobacillus sp. CUG 92003 TaxID=2736641 RepID=UPI0015E71FC8|nr:mechanosensitive ion channel family protein [Thalassobacillus sp. CUG 92003]
MNLEQFDFLSLAGWIVGGALVFILIVFILRRLIHSFFKKTEFIEERKEKTLESMINSIIGYAATFGYIIFVLEVLDVPITKILAGAGVIGIIVGFGAQNLIRDFFAGLFLLYEKQLHKGDFVTVNSEHHGNVEDIGLRFLKIREWSGKLLTMSNGQIKTIENYNFEHMRVIEHITTNFHEDPKKMFDILHQACNRLNDELGTYLKKDLTDRPFEPFQLYGMSSLNHENRGYQYTVTGLVSDLVYWTASKETRRIMAETLYEHQIELAEQRIELKSAPQKDNLE